MNRPCEPFVGVVVALLMTVGLYVALAAGCGLALALVGAVLP